MLRAWKLFCTSALSKYAVVSAVQAGSRAEQPKGAAGDAAPAAPQTPRAKETRPSSLSAAKGVAEKLMQGKQRARASAQDS